MAPNRLSIALRTRSNALKKQAAKKRIQKKPVAKKTPIPASPQPTDPMRAQLEKLKKRLAAEKNKNTRLMATREMDKKKIASLKLENKETSKLKKLADTLEQQNSDLEDELYEAEDRLKEKGAALDAYKELCKEMTAEQENARQGKPIVPNCEICQCKYGLEEEHTPRILKCGHSVCLGCAKQVFNDNFVVCPFDRTWTYLKKVEDLPKNFTVLDMCN